MTTELKDKAFEVIKKKIKDQTDDLLVYAYAGAHDSLERTHVNQISSAIGRLLRDLTDRIRALESVVESESNTETKKQLSLEERVVLLETIVANKFGAE